LFNGTGYTDKKGNKSFLIYKEIQMGAVAKCFLIYEEMCKYLVIYDFATAPYWISLYERNFFSVYLLLKL
jgi:hypothetical protein